ncbi:MAG: DUF58 domain-containing protein [Clostridiaceae bacterium]|nr:DUF58 domain-containing protein [Clostridiaceae bacterium]
MLLYLIFFAIAAALLQEYSLRHALDKVTYDTFASKSTVDPGESFEIITRISNPKLLPVSFLRVQESLPSELEPEGDIALRRDSEQCRLTMTTFLRPRQMLERRFKASIPKRGRYFLRGATLFGGDFLGLKQTSCYYPISQELVVLPSELPGTNIGRTLGDFLGDMSVTRFIMEDPVLTLGFREYTGREPQRAISWTQSARMGMTMVKNYDHTLDLSATVILNVEYPDGLPSAHAKIEDCFSAARSVCSILEQRKVKYGIITNATSAGAIGLWSQIGDGLGKTHLMTILEGLGRATYSSTGSFASIMSKAMRHDEAGRYFIVITPSVTESSQTLIQRLSSLKGLKAFVIDTSRLSKEE